MRSAQTVSARGSFVLVLERGLSPAEAKDRDPPINGKGGALLDGRLHREFPGERRAMVTAPVAGAAGW